MDYLLQRRGTLHRTLKKDGIDALLITDPANVTYLTGFTGDSSYCVLTPRTCTLISDSRFEQQIQEECREMEIAIRPHDRTTLELTAEILTKSGVKNAAIEAEHVTIAFLAQIQEKAPKVTFTPTSGRVESMRVIKDMGEVEQIRASIKAAERAFGMFKPMLREADTEKDMVDALEGYIRRAGGRGSSFPPIVAVGDRGALPHAPPTDRQLGDASKLLVDWGADLMYKSDLTRTFRSPFGTAPTRKNKQERVGFNFDEVYEVVAKAHREAVNAIMPGVKAKEIDAVARATMAEAKLRDDPGVKLEDYFTHGLGHGIGLETHELPRVRANSEDTLEVGMVITIEPGIYIPGWGGVRLEDDYLVTRDGASRLSTLPWDPGAIG